MMKFQMKNVINYLCYRKASREKNDNCMLCASFCISWSSWWTSVLKTL